MKKMKMKMKKKKMKKIMSKETKILLTNEQTNNHSSSFSTDHDCNVYSSCVVEDVLIDFIKASVFGLS